MVLADLGARVLKIESPDGDDARNFGPFSHGKSVYFESLNRGKESIVLDLTAPQDREIFKKLVRKADMVIENYRANTMQKLGFGWETLRALNPRLIYAAISGFGKTGPYQNFAAYDMVVQALGGIMSITGHPGQPPTRVGTSIGDITAGLFGLCGVLSALHQRELSGTGCMVDIGMLDCQVAILENAIGRYLSVSASGHKNESPTPLGMRHPSITPFDGFKVGNEYLIIAVGNDVLFHKLCVALGNEALTTRAEFNSNALRTENHAMLKHEIETALSGKSLTEWLAILQQAGVPCSPIHDIAQVVNDSHIQARNMIINSLDEHDQRIPITGSPIKISGYDDPSTRPAAPHIDQDREKILKLVE